MEIKDNYIGYYFIITYNNGLEVKDDARLLNITELYQFDKLTMNGKDYRSYLDEVSKRYGLNNTEVKEVKIGCNTKQGNSYFYSIVSNNPYVKNVISSIIDADIYGTNKYSTKRYVIKQENDTFQEVKEFLLKKVKEEGISFINEYFPKESSFKDALIKYYDIYKQQYQSREDTDELYRLQRNITQQLAVYGDFRNFVIKKYKKESYKFKQEDQDKRDLEVSAKTLERIEKEYYKKIEERDNTLNNTNDFNRKYEEYIEPDEYDQMTGYVEGRVK